jgi:hypothetical protein
MFQLNNFTERNLIKKTILLVGPLNLKYLATALRELTEFEIAHLKGGSVLDFLAKRENEIVAVVTELYQSNGSGLCATGMDNALIAGLIVIQRLQPLCPNAIFFLINGYDQRIVQPAGKIVFLRQTIPVRLEEMRNKVAQALRAQPAGQI